MASVIEGGSIQGSSERAGKERMKEMGGITRDRVYQKVDSRKGEVVQGLHDLASTLEKASRQVTSGMARQALDSAVGFIHKATDRIENETTAELLDDARDRIRERPAFFVAGCVALGFLAGRFLKI